MTTTDRTEFRTLLEQERQRIADAIQYLASENPGNMQDELGDVGGWGTDNHLGDMASVTFDRELDEGLEDGAQYALDEIEAALGRIEDGSYGVCEVCGKPIGAERLTAIPWARLCIDDQRRLG